MYLKREDQELFAMVQGTKAGIVCGRSPIYRSKDGSKMMFQLRATQTTFLATGAALAFMTVAFGDYVHAESNLDASYTISFARVRVGDITATIVVGDNEYTISARGRAGGVMKVLLDGEASFHTAPSRTVIPCRQLSPPRSSPMPKPRM
jgi:hypothetical protein